jgi:RecB family endonuclease NucS
MPIYEFASEEIRALSKTTFSLAQLQERRDLQRLLSANDSVVAPDTLVIAEEFGDWDEPRRRIDLLGIDRDANLVVIELKRTEDGGHLGLQSIRYVAMVSTMTFDQAAGVFGRYLTQIGKSTRMRAPSCWTSSGGTSPTRMRSRRMSGSSWRRPSSAAS